MSCDGGHICRYMPTHGDCFRQCWSAVLYKLHQLTISQYHSVLRDSLPAVFFLHMPTDLGRPQTLYPAASKFAGNLPTRSDDSLTRTAQGLRKDQVFQKYRTLIYTWLLAVCQATNLTGHCLLEGALTGLQLQHAQIPRVA